MKTITEIRFLGIKDADNLRDVEVQIAIKAQYLWAIEDALNKMIETSTDRYAIRKICDLLNKFDELESNTNQERLENRL